MSDQEQPQNRVYHCQHCGAYTAIPGDEPFTDEDDYCGSCGKSYFEAPEAEEEHEREQEAISGQYDEFLNTIAGKLNKEELLQVKTLITALELNQETMQEVSDMLVENAENALSVAADEFNRRMAYQEALSRKVREEARDRMELSHRLAEPINNAPASSFYDPHGELKPVPVTHIVGDDTPAQHFTNTNVKQFIEKRLSLALVALQNSHSLNEPTTANLSDDQDDEDPAIATIAWYVESIIGLIVDISEMSVVVLED